MVSWPVILLASTPFSYFQELNLSFCEIKRDAALAVAEAVADKAELEKLDLNGNRSGGLGPRLPGRPCCPS